MATLPATTILRSGESASPKLSSKTTKTYYHAVRGAKFIMPDGLEIQFMGGQFTTDDAEIMTELDAVANKPASMISTSLTGVASTAKLTADAAAAAITS
jgi:hypothetical protein